MEELTYMELWKQARHDEKEIKKAFPNYSELVEKFKTIGYTLSVKCWKNTKYPVIVRPKGKRVAFLYTTIEQAVQRYSSQFVDYSI